MGEEIGIKEHINTILLICINEWMNDEKGLSQCERITFTRQISIIDQ